MMKRIKRLGCLLLVFCLITGCERFLDAKPDKKLAVPSTLRDLQALLDDYTNTTNQEPFEGEISSTDFYVTDNNWLSLSLEEYRMFYLWQKHSIAAERDISWTSFGKVMNYANTVLENIDKIEKTPGNETEYNNVKGQAYFCRAKTLLQAAFIWCLAYDENTSEKDLGLPLRLDSDFNKPSVRSNVKETYMQIISDINKSIHLLPETPLHVSRSSKAAAYGLMARTYLSMRDYKKAGLYADSCLRIKNTLIDYNTLNSKVNAPFSMFNEEVIMDTMIPAAQILNTSRALIVPELYDLYAENDLRKIIFFRDLNGGKVFKGSYRGNISLFGGIATNEMYLIRAECSVRSGDLNSGLNDINTLLVKRWEKDTYLPFVSLSRAEALELILKERRKELVMRGIRWPDIKRLNKEGAELVLTRDMQGKTYTLLPNDQRYALPLPDDIIEISGMKQNPY